MSDPSELENEPVRLEYLTPKARHRPSWKPVRVAICFNILPLAAGLAIFGAWIVTRADWLQIAGLLDLGFGVVCTFASLLSLSIYVCLLQGSFRERLLGFFQGAWVALLLMALNYPIAWLVLQGVDYVECHYPVTVQTANTDSDILQFPP